MTTPLEAYLTGVVYTNLIQDRLPDHLHPHPVVTDGQITGVIELHTPNGDVRATVVITEEHGR